MCLVGCAESKHEAGRIRLRLSLKDPREPFARRAISASFPATSRTGGKTIVGGGRISNSRLRDPDFARLEKSSRSDDRPLTRDLPRRVKLRRALKDGEERVVGHVIPDGSVDILGSKKHVCGLTRREGESHQGPLSAGWTPGPSVECVSYVKIR